MRRHLMWMLSLAAVLSIVVTGVVLAASEPPTVVRVGNLVTKLNGEITPHALPRDKPVPIRFWDSYEFGTADGSQPPAVEHVVIDGDKNAFVDARGLPVCRQGQLEAVDTAHAEKACDDAILGRGSGTVRVAFPEQTPFEATGPLVFFNGGVVGGVITVFAHAYVSVPAPTAIVIPVKISREHKGRFGVHVAVTIPEIAGGSGSAINAQFYNHRLFTYKGSRRSFLSAMCPDGHLTGRGTFAFHDGTTLSGTVTRTCKPTG